MARIRTIKPDFFTSEDIVSLSPLARLFYIALWCEADREGRLSWKLGTLKMRYLPGDDAPVQDLADELVTAGLVVLYEREGNHFAEIPGFSKHQVINNKEQQSQIPPRVKDACKTRESGVQGERKEGKEGKELAFNAFWAVYPNRKSKGAAEKAFARINPDEQLLQAIVAGVKRAKTSAQWLKNGGEFIPYPASWLNAKGWEDELPVADVEEWK